MTREFSAASRSDLDEVAHVVRHHLPGKSFPTVLYLVHERRLMLPTGALRVASCVFGVTDWCLRRLRLVRPPGYYVFLRKLHERDPAMGDMLGQVMDHMRHGHDEEDRDSVGGWSQRELDLFVAIVAAHVPEQAWAEAAAWSARRHEVPGVGAW